MSWCFNEAAGIPRGRLHYAVINGVTYFSCFNEAAGIPRGRRRIVDVARNTRSLASMRPRVFPAEDAEKGGYDTFRICFNEAAGIPRGRPGHCVTATSRLSRFNEAAGIPRGRREARRVYPDRSFASMRPRVFPAEDQQLWRKVSAMLLASMRPRVFPAEDDIGTRRVCLLMPGFNEAAGIPRGRQRAFQSGGVIYIRLQ